MRDLNIFLPKSNTYSFKANNLIWVKDSILILAKTKLKSEKKIQKLPLTIFTRKTLRKKYLNQPKLQE